MVCVWVHGCGCDAARQASGPLPWPGETMFRSVSSRLICEVTSNPSSKRCSNKSARTRPIGNTATLFYLDVVLLVARARRRAARRRRDSVNRWSPMPPAALAVTAKGASCAARAVPSEGIRTTRTTRGVSRLIASRMVFRHRARARHRGLDKSDQRVKSVSFGSVDQAWT